MNSKGGCGDLRRGPLSLPADSAAWASNPGETAEKMIDFLLEF